MTTAPALDIAPLTRDEVLALAEEAIARELAVLDDLAPEEWDRPTACPAWTVRQVVVHQVACAQAFLSPVEGARQQLAGRRLARSEGLPPLDAFMQAGQRARDAWTPAEARTRAEEVLPRFARYRRRFPEPLRSLVTVPTNGPRVRLGHLFDRVINRDVWMHRIDVCDATGRAPVVTADHDGRLVQDVVAEWADLHGQPFDLELTGPAGGSWSRGSGGERIRLDAIDFARTLSGRRPAEGLLRTEVLF